MVTVAFVSPSLPTLSIDMACEWVTPTEVGWYYTATDVTVAGEQVHLELNPKAEDPASLLWIGRDGAAGYQASVETGTVELAEHAANWSAGQIIFKELAPDPETWGSGPLPSPITTWIRPLGGDPDNAILSGSAGWECEPAPPTVPTPAPAVSEAPERTPPPVPHVVLVSGAQRDAGDLLCGSFDIDGFTASDGCGIGFLWLGSDHAVRIPAGSKLRFELPTGWHFTRWSVGWATEAEAERFRGNKPDTFVDAASGKSTGGRVLEVDAPATGDWDVELDWVAGRGEDSASFPSFFRAIVEP